MLAEGKSTKDIAAASEPERENHRDPSPNIMEKLNLFSIAELTKYAIAEGLTTLEK